MQILVMGGTRFVGKPLVARLMAQGHALTLFTRGKNPVPAGVEHITGAVSYTHLTLPTILRV